MIGTRNQDIIIACEQIVWASNRPSYELPAIPHLGAAVLSGEGLPAPPTWVEISAGASAEQIAPLATEEKGLRSFPTLAAFYCVASPMAVEKFLVAHAGLVPLLFSAFPKIKSYWGTEINPALTIVDDPEGGFSVLVVGLSSNKLDAYVALDRFDEEWWLDHIKDAQGLLNFSLSPK
jgi:hypothetical protein